MSSDTGPFYASALNRLLDQRYAIPGTRRTWILAPFTTNADAAAVFDIARSGFVTSNRSSSNPTGRRHLSPVAQQLSGRCIEAERTESNHHSCRRRRRHSSNVAV